MILVTGASGFIGSHFHNAIPQEKLINLDINEPNFKHSSLFYKGDIRIKEDVRSVLKKHKIETIISLAAKHHDFGIGHDEYFDTNEDGTRVVCECASEFGISTIVFFSSVAVYGIREAVSTESMEPSPDSPYGASKLAGEKVLYQWVQESPDRKVIILRPTIVFGPNNMANMRNLIKQIDSGLYFHLGAADNVKSIAYVENVVAAALYLTAKKDKGLHIYNYADEPQLTTREIATTIASALRKKIFLTIPKFVGILFGLPFDLIIKLTGKNLPISTARIKKLGTQTYHSAKKLFDEGFKPAYTTRDGLKKMVDWYLLTKK